MRWSAPGQEATVGEVVARFAAARWPEPPAGFARIGARREMRQVFLGPEGTGPRVVVKWIRPVTVFDRLACAWRGGKGVREGRVLLHLGAAGVRVPRVLGWSDEGADLLVLEEIPGLLPVPPGAEVGDDLAEATARLLGRAFRVGLRHPDLHPGNLALVGGEPVLVDLGRARIVRGRGGLVREAARRQVALAHDLRRSLRLRAFLAWLSEAQGRPPSGAGLRALVRRVDRRARRIAARYRRGRDRRATRTGRHFEVLRPSGGGSVVRRGEAPEAWVAEASSWLRGTDPPGAVSLKGDGRVLRFRREDGPADLVLKRYGPVFRGRLPRPVLAFRRSVWLEHRGIATPRAFLAAAGPDGSGFLVSGHAGAPDLHRFAGGGRGGELAKHPPARRRALARSLGRFLRALHDADLFHRDLKAPNLLVDLPVDGPPRIWIADLDGLRRRRPSLRRRARDLARLDASLDATRTDRLRTLCAYLAPLPRLLVDERRFLAWVSLAVERKRGPSGRPR